MNVEILTDKKVHIPTLFILNNENKKIINVKKKNRFVRLWKLGEKDIAKDETVPVNNTNNVDSRHFNLPLSIVYVSTIEYYYK